jgi:DNA invertase Pin-like site-specific DNA recombinase
VKQTRCAIYARVSGNGQNPEMQIKELQTYCRRRGWQIVGEYVDRITGTKDSRPELNRLMADAHRRRFGFLVVWKFDRFARSVSHLLRALETFRSLNIQFASLTEQIDTSTPTGKMVFTILGSVAELERSLIGERVKAGLRNATANGVKLGRPPLRELSIAEIRQLRRERGRTGKSFRGLAHRYGISVWTAFQLCKSKA